MTGREVDLRLLQERGHPCLKQGETRELFSAIFVQLFDASRIILSTAWRK